MKIFIGFRLKLSGLKLQSVPRDDLIFEFYSKFTKWEVSCNKTFRIQHIIIMYVISYQIQQAQSQNI